MAELVENITEFERSRIDTNDITHRRVLFPDPAIRTGRGQCKGHDGDGKNIRFPWIHKSDPLDFHSANTLLSKNHAAVPLRRALKTKSWFVEGSGGESQR